MVVYDRVVPNEAIESLIALSIGVMIALGFDFLTKSLRANFIDRASKRADARMSRMVFDKILTLRLDSGNQSSGGVASVVREFDSLREFFTSATLVAIVDLPFIFFFVYVVYLIGGNIAIVPLAAGTLRVDYWGRNSTYLSPPRLRIHANRHVETSCAGRNFEWFGYNTSDRLRTLDEKPF
jgi:ABC-type bacteriocin/lantibiotic exporter with double-glycine peptidase domain